MQYQKIMPDGSKRLKQFSTTILRKIRKLDYLNATLMPGYERTEKEYLALRDNINAANIVIKDIMCYEHGNRHIKFLKDGLQMLSDNVSLDMYRSRNMFESFSLITRKLAMMSFDMDDRETANKFSISCKNISDCKNKLNARLEQIRLNLKQKRIKSVDIDRDRKKMKNMRYDLELLLQDKEYNNEIKEVEKKEFYTYSSKVLKDMIAFNDDSSLSDTLKEVSHEYMKYLRESADLLKNIE